MQLSQLRHRLECFFSMTLLPGALHRRRFRSQHITRLEELDVAVHGEQTVSTDAPEGLVACGVCDVFCV